MQSTAPAVTGESRLVKPGYIIELAVTHIKGRKIVDKKRLRLQGEFSIESAIFDYFEQVQKRLDYPPRECGWQKNRRFGYYFILTQSRVDADSIQFSNFGQCREALVTALDESGNGWIQTPIQS